MVLRRPCTTSYNLSQAATPSLGEHFKPGAKYVWEYTLYYCGRENTLTAEGSRSEIAPTLEWSL